jgi:phospholipase C
VGDDLGRSGELSRKQFLVGAASAALSLSPLASSATRRPTSSALPSPAQSGLEHVVVVTMENRSFDHMLGWLPGAAGAQAGLSYPDRKGGSRATYHLTDFQGCGHPDPDHSYEGARAEYNEGRCDGWLVAGSNDEYAIGYYERSDLAFFGPAAPAWTVCDHYFSSILGPTYPNRF